MKTKLRERMFEIKEEIYEHALSESAGAFYRINITQNKVPGTMWQVLDGKEYSINEAIGLPVDCNYTEVVNYWGNKLKEDEQAGFFSFFDLENLKKCFENGNTHISHRYWTNDVMENPMLAEQHIVMYTDLETEEIHGITYILDLTNIAVLRAREAEQRKHLEKALKDAEEANKAKSLFLFNMSHDIRTPMNAVMGFIKIAKNHLHDSERVLDALEKADTSGHHMLAIINDVLDMSHIESGNLEFHPEQVMPSELVKTIHGMYGQAMEDKGIEFIIEVGELPEAVILDGTRVIQVIGNLLSNATKFTNQGGKICFAFKQTGIDEDGKACLEVSVKDTGIGMSEDFQKKAFHIFERERTSTDSGVEGTGLGLAIAKKIALAMGGELVLNSKLGEGTEFVFSFRAELTKWVEAENITIEEEPQIDVDFTGKRILLVEDIELNREIAVEILTAEGFIVEEAEDGQQSVDMVEQSEPGYYDCVLMDIQMPIMNGYEATRKIRTLENPLLANIPVVAMTANAFVEDQRNALEAGMNGHIPKPIDVNKLLCELNKIIFLGRR